MELEDQIRYALNSSVKRNVLDREKLHDRLLERTNNSGSSKKKWFKKIAPVFAAVSGLFILFTGATFATGQNPFYVIVNFVHNIGVGDTFGSSYYFENGLFKEEGNPNNLRLSNYHKELDNFIGMASYPKLPTDKITVTHVSASVSNKEKEKFYVIADGVTKAGGYTTEEYSLNLSIYHNANSTIHINGQTTSENQKTVSLSGVEATYIRFSNGNNRDISYITWKNGPWTVVVQSFEIPENDLIAMAQDINKQIR
ncbi:hypothetical protein IAQ67_14715 [Paenibacillus peoriae]|uniref:DUF4367 domain-containing protein n=1 Tax=Paenibacillus peoriae TaxID=59893 RepID=A0A7H0Y258_9BACL|nr:hypothetical protein [Paenibacillus peoriae]QNR65166.1 hypothetical protein IAQ67_14715 [Paenibacillus peoriae]